ncbi:hypothetical protein TNCV_3390621 [Trichonephila clavipes]|nr:hypothetical protein TNCV_3390621 [Trichonephila clavipes]
MQISRETVLENVTQNLEMRKTYCRLVPHHLTYNQKQARSEGSQNFVETADVTPNFLNCIVTEDESWCLRHGIIHKDIHPEGKTINAAM